MGNSTKSNNFSIAYCHPSHCNIGSQLNVLHLNSSGSYLGSTNSTISLPLCYGSRTGDACGECIPNYSVVFGSTECKDCSSIFWPFTIILYIIAGPLLVLLLYTLKLTLTTGTLNGIIFYAQIANIGIMHYLNIPCNECTKELVYLIRPASVFISWLNLNLGFPLCFYNGMTEILKAGLSLLFPVYLILIVGLLIILSRYSVKISNRFSRSSIQVLVTIVHLSITKLLQSVLDIFSSGKVYTEGVDMPKTVWYNNGTIAFNSESHIWLMIVTSIVAGLILIPYFIVILLGKFLLKFDKLREYIRPFYEAIHAPYRRNKWYWFALHQLFVLFTYVSETFSKGQVPLFLSLLLIYHILLYLQTKLAPFRYKTLNWLNLMILLALNIVFLVSQYMYLTNDSPKQLVMFFAIANYPIIAVFMLIIAYHILLVTNKVNRVLLLYQNVKECFPGLKQKRQYDQRRRPYSGCSDSGDYTEAREPLLEQTLIN
uniref:TRP C-terminal domain-containing protein n=1 Tax=Amphimedon queenslandica TaxID=400682 RepID=A0A1X7V2Q6_AMPQE